MLTELERIRKKFRASRKQFGEVFLGKSETAVKYYEKGKTKIPASVESLARAWEYALDQIRGTEWQKKKNTK